MVYYYTIPNIRQLRSLGLEFNALSEITAHEFMKEYIEKWPENVEESKLTWLVETFLSLQRHKDFLNETVTRLAKPLSDEDQDYFTIILHSVIFQITPKDMPLLYKTLFTLSKNLLYNFTKIFSNNEVLTYVSQLAQSHYDASYITEKIIGPLFIWQPYISEMDHDYSEYVSNVEKRKIKPLTVPIHPNVLNRKTKEPSTIPVLPPIPNTPPNSYTNKGKKMLTKDAIDRRLKTIHEKNKQKANELLSIVKNNEYGFTRPKQTSKVSAENVKKEEMKYTKSSKYKTPLPPVAVRQNVATVKRINKMIANTEQQELQWINNLISCCCNVNKIDTLIENDRIETEREHQYEVERKHLLGLLSFEEAVIAKRKIQEQNREKYEQYLKEKETWNEEIEKWRLGELERRRRGYESQALTDLSIAEKKNNIISRNKEKADSIKKDIEIRIAEVMKAKQEELERKIKMIKEIKVLSLIAKKARLPKVIDLTESSGVGLLCEMSIAELQERLAAYKINLNDELQKRKVLIREAQSAEKKKLEDLKLYNQNYAQEKAMVRQQKKPKPICNLEPLNFKEIDGLKKLLEEKRNVRIKAELRT